MIYAMRDTYSLPTWKFGWLWSSIPSGWDGSRFRGALQIYIRLPHLRLLAAEPAPYEPWDTRRHHDATAWTGRRRALLWRITPGQFTVYLRTPSGRDWTFSRGVSGWAID